MAAPQQPVSPQVVGNAFVQQYYHILHQSPGLVHRFYQNISKLGRLEEDGSMSITTTMDAINAKILSLNYDEFRVEIKSVDAQESLSGGVNVLVTGYLTGKDNVLKKFTQSFFLAPQDKGYFVLNDMFRYIEESVQNNGNIDPIEHVEDSINPEQVVESVQMVENNITDQVVHPPKESEVEVVINPPENAVVEMAFVEEKEALPQVVDEVQVTVVEEIEAVPQVVDEVQVAVVEEKDAVPVQPVVEVESSTKIEETPKKSYASIVMDLKQNGVPFSSPAPVPKKHQPRIQEQKVNSVPPPVPVPESAISKVGAVENDIHEEEGEGFSIYIKGLPMSATPAMLEDEFKKFGPIKPNGIQVRSHRGFCFGFVEFEQPDAVQKAIEASPVIIGGRNTVAEEKRSTYSKGARGRFPVGRGGGGFRNEGLRGRGNYGGGRGYNRVGEFGGGRNDYGGNRGGVPGGAPPNRGDGYHRERVNRGVVVNGTAKNMAPRVSATA
ncbi:nuclear transport factor 2-like isoform X2 [Bidens hawaiensis]|uniref:nuclear transport factor 2-like isoform X2 n=1 Tax=Bidens hawaiensis TaxID=980011 RepID=UPI00404A7754